MSVSHRARRALAAPVALAAAAALALAPTAAYAAEPDAKSPLKDIKHIVVIYEENHSFDNLFGTWEGVNGRAQADHHSAQVGTDGTPLPCLPQNDPVLKAATGADKCGGLKLNDGTTATSPFANQPFRIDDYITPATKSCPGGAAGGCTRDLVHRFYQEQYQIDGGKQDRYTVGSDALGLTQGYYDTTGLRLYKYLHSAGAPNYTIADDFFQGAFGGSFLNHQWLIAANTPVYTGAVPTPDTLHSVVDKDGEPTRYPLQPTKAGLVDGPLTQKADADGKCVVPAGGAKPPKGTVCGDYAVNTIQPAYQPHGSGPQLQPLTDPTIGDRLNDKGVDWAWYAGGWSNANGNVGGPGWTNGTGPACDPTKSASKAYPFCPDPLFQFHHQPFAYYANYGKAADGVTDSPGRAAHLRDEVEFRQAAKAGKLKPVSFVKPSGEENEHPGYASQDNGDHHLVDLLQDVETGKDAANTMVVVTYDEFGGQWDHVSPPKVDEWGPGTRIPAVVISPKLPKKFAIDSTQYDTTSILTTIEKRFNLDPLTKRDKKGNDLSGVFTAPAGPGGGSGGGNGGGTGNGGSGGGSGEGLPITGLNIAALVLAGLALVFVGGGAVVLGRRRRAG